MKDILTARKLVRDFKTGETTVRAVDNISLTVPRKKLTLLVGRSGSGKTTLINLLGALDIPDQGEIIFNEENIARLEETRRDHLRKLKMGFVFQSVALLPLMNAYENVDFSLRLCSFPYKLRHERIVECLTLVGLQERITHMPEELSGGEQQRVAIARAIAHSPQILFADEPTAELDTHTALKVVQLFKSLIDHNNITIVMTSHDPGMIEVADKVYYLEDGRIVKEK